jgi:hypothetical protein
MLALFGEWTWAFLLFVGTVLAVLGWASWLVRPWAWEMTLVVYSIGVLGSLWQVSVASRRGGSLAVVNGGGGGLCRVTGGPAGVQGSLTRPRW